MNRRAWLYLIAATGLLLGEQVALGCDLHGNPTDAGGVVPGVEAQVGMAVDATALRAFAAESGGTCATLPLALTENLVNGTSDYANSVHSGDLDGDGDVDLVVASGFDDKVAWYENDGSSTPRFTQHIITTSADFARAVFTVDLDGDDDVDVLVGAGFGNSVSWYENDGGQPPVFTQRVITTTTLFPRWVTAADLDGDGDVDVVSASNNDDKIAWYQNNGAQPPVFTTRVITTTADGARSLSIGDINGDGFADIVAASGLDNVIAWYRSNGAATPTFTRQVITSTALGIEWIQAARVDADGDIDIVAASVTDNTIAWYDNGGGLNPTFTRRVITSTATFASAAIATDFDNDGLTDIVAAASATNQVMWWRNMGGTPPTFTFLMLASGLAPISLHSADVDDDGRQDIVAALSNEDRVMVYEVGAPPNGSCCRADLSCQQEVCLSDCAFDNGWSWREAAQCADVVCPGAEAPASFLTEALDYSRFKKVIFDLAAYGTRYWNLPGNDLAVAYIKNKLESYGYEVVLDPYLYSGVTKHNVYATKLGTVRPTEMYVLGAHLDSFNVNGNFADAPGADDDASGVSSVLEMARVFGRARTEVSIRFILWNNEETGLNGSTAYVQNHRNLQGTTTEPTWLGMIQQDMILYDRGPGAIPDADVEYQLSATENGAAVLFANFVAGAMSRYGAMPAEVGNNMMNTDSWPFRTETPSISVRENQRVAEIGAGSNPHWHQPTDLYGTFHEQDFQFGFNIVRMVCGAVGELTGAIRAGDHDLDGDLDLSDYGEFLQCRMGPEVGISAGCETFDFNSDGDVDLSDLGRFQEYYTGP